MSIELQKLRGELLREALLKGWTRPSDVQAPWTHQLEQARIERWYRKLYKSALEPLPVGQRLANHFLLGADPEFVLHDGANRVDARVLDLKAGPAFGADNNGRLCELRPEPSRSALAVLASMWLAMRWMVVYHPDVLPLHWRAGSYYLSDGLGGHIHFGRKRKKFREREVLALDRLAHLQFVAGIFDREEGRLRVRQAQGAPAGQPYGALGDVRLQPHGWEYRTLPSWLDNPWLAYFNLVTSKLVVAFSDLVPTLCQADATLSAEQARQQLRMLLAYFAPADDDARLALAILTRRGLPGHASGMVFKQDWGLFNSGPLGSAKEADPPALFPVTVPSRTEDEVELSQAMFENRPPELVSLKPTWTPHELPKDYVHMIRFVDTKLAPGLGEFAMGLCTHSQAPLKFVNMGHSSLAFRFPFKMSTKIEACGLLTRLQVPVDCRNEEYSIHINASKDFTLEQLLQARTEIVKCGIFPIWDINDVQADSIERWKQAQTARAPAPVKKGSKVEFQGNV